MSTAKAAMGDQCRVIEASRHAACTNGALRRGTAAPKPTEAQSAGGKGHREELDVVVGLSAGGGHFLGQPGERMHGTGNSAAGREKESRSLSVIV
eukprot:3940308-Pleurochrysis_carterae.AAC.1